MKKNTNQKEEQNQYGILSMIAMVVGIVVGSGIFVVNNSLYSISNSIGLSVISWILVSVIIIFMLISFIEISSITALKHKPGTFNNWSRSLFNKKFSKYLGFYFPVIYFPVLLSGFSILASMELVGNFEYFNGINKDNNQKIFIYFLLTTILAFLFLNSIFTINIFTSKPGKIIQQVGTVIKLIPIFLIILLGMIIVVGIINVDSWNDLFDWNSEYNNWEKNGDSFLFLILLMFPTIMFSFDGFLFAASLQNESKKPSSYKIAVIFGIILIIALYLLMSIFSFMFAEGTQFSISSVIENITGWKWLGSLVSIIIVTSILVGASGVMISQNRMLADVSLNNQILDKDGILISRNKASVPQYSAYLLWIITMVYFAIFRFLDLISVLTYIYDGTNGDISFSSFNITGWSLSFFTLISYSFYTLLIFGGLINRFTKKVEVEKNKLFIPSAIISIISTIIIIIIFSISIFYPKNFVIDNQASLFYISNYILQIIVSISILALVFLVPIFFEKRVNKNLNSEILENKQKYIDNYNEGHVDQRFYNKIK